LFWHALIGHPGAESAGASLAFTCAHCEELEQPSLRINNMAAQRASREDLEEDRLRENSQLLRGHTTLSFGTYRGLVMLYFNEFTLNLAMNDAQLEMVIAGLRAQQTKLRDEQA